MENNFQFASAAVSDRGLSEKRPQNEDSYLVLKQQGLFAVADGVGGAQAGDVASQMAVEILAEAFTNMQIGSDAEDVMKLGIERANAAIYQMSRELPQLSTMATTVVALHLSGNIATIGHVGDSRLYRLDGGGNLYRETQDHSIVEEEVRAGRMTVAQAANHPSRNVISRAVGAESAVEVDMKTIMFEPNTTFLLCSDGVTRHISDFEIRELLSSNANQEDICQQIKSLCYERGAEDNLTAVIISVLHEVVRADSAFRAAAPTDFEEATVAGVRPAIVPPIETNNAHFDRQDYSTQKLDQIQPPTLTPEFAKTENYQPHIEIEDDTDEIEPHIPIRQTPPASKSLETTNEIAGTSVNQAVIERDEKEFRIGDESGNSSFGRLLSSLLFLLIGGIIGAAAYHFLAPNAVPPPAPAPQITEMRTPNIPFSAFEENRRNVDANPQQFISANQTSPQDAIDYYLLGRAYLLSGKYPEAKQALTEARNRLAQTDPVNSRTLANEIAMSLAIINNPFAQNAFAKDITASGENAASSANSNSSINSNR